MRGIILILILLFIFSCVPEKSIQDLEEGVRQNKVEKLSTVVTGVYLSSVKYNHVWVVTESGFEFEVEERRIDKYHEGDTIYYYVDKKGELLTRYLK